MKPYQLVIDASASSLLMRTVKLCGGLVRWCLGDRHGRATVQAYHPFPALVVDRTTRQVQLMAKRIRASCGFIGNATGASSAPIGPAPLDDTVSPRFRTAREASSECPVATPVSSL
jgi:hypothetical protein